MRTAQASPTLFDRALIWFALSAYAVGAWVRIKYGLIDHPARHFVVSDAANMLEGMNRMVSGAQSIWDTVWPPGEMAFTALMSRFDATLTSAELVQTGLSLVLPWLVADVARQVSTRRGFWFGLAAASLHIGFLHYIGFFLSESLFQAVTVLAIWLTTTALSSLNAHGASRNRVWALGLSAGIAWGLAVLFRPNALPILLALCTGLALLSYKIRGRGFFGMACAALTGAILVIAPAAERCSSLSGKFCPVSSNFAMNVALGQAGEHAGLIFETPDHTDISVWMPPALLDHGYVDMDRVPASIFDTNGVLLWVRDRVLHDPMTALRNVLHNATDTFNVHTWPYYYGTWPRSVFSIGAWAFVLLVIMPGAWGITRVARNLVLKPAEEPAAFVAIIGVFAVFGLAAISLGEARYRYPFDIWWIALAARAFWPPDVAPFAMDRARVLLFGTATACAVLSATIITLTFNPATSLASRLSPSPQLPAGVHIDAAADQLARPRASGTQWNNGTVVLRCDNACAELSVHWPMQQHSQVLDLSTHYDDAYRVAFYQGDSELAFVDLPLLRTGSGLVRRFIAVPKKAVDFDNVRITPLYGSATYSVGHVRVPAEAMGNGLLPDADYTPAQKGHG
ncbi:MAG TPA: hypothetical protein VFR06_03300 [Gallionellaceae bacterium]|nr:hypothetical protein [Gallionellaceae bacterium]